MKSIFNNKNIYLKYVLYYIFFSTCVFSFFILKGNTLVQVGDPYEENFTAFFYTGKYLRKFLKELIISKQIQQIDFTIGMGENIIGTLNYAGFGSVFNILSVFSNESNVAIWFSVTQMLKFFFAGVAFIYSTMKIIDCSNDRILLLAACMYSFCPYSLFYGLNYTTFLDLLVFLPIIFCGLYEIVKHQNYVINLVMILGVGCIGFSGYYDLYIITMICIVCFLVLELVNNGCNIRRMATDAMKIGVNFIVGIMLAAIVLVPSVAAFLKSTRTNENYFKDVMFSLYNIDDVIYRVKSIVCAEGYKASIGIGWLGILMCILLIRNRKINKEYTALVLIIGIAYFLPVTGSIMNAFSYSVDRWIFVINYLVALVIVWVMENSNEYLIRKTDIIIYIILELIWTIAYWYKNPFSWGHILKYAIYTLVWLVLVILFAINDDITVIVNNKCKFSLLCICVLVIPVLVNAPVKLGGDGWSAAFVSLEEIKKANENIYPYDNDFYRVDGMKEVDNEAILIEQNGVNIDFSIVNSNIYNFYKKLGIASGIYGSDCNLRFLDNRPNLRNLLCVKYYYDGNNVLLNDGYLPLGVIMDSYITEEEANKYSQLDRNMFLSEMLIVNDELGINAALKNNLNNLSKARKLDKNIEIVHNENEDNILISVDDCADKYVILKNFRYKTNGLYRIYVNGTEITINNEVDQCELRDGYDYLVYVGEENDIKVDLPTGDWSFDDVQVFSVPIEYRGINISENSTVNNCCVKTNKLEFDAILKDTGLLFAAVPYSDNWNVYVDGEKATIVKADYGFMAVQILPGRHKIVFTYVDKWFYVGIALTGLAIVFVCVYTLKNTRKKDNNNG